MPYPDESSAVPVLILVKHPEAPSLEYPTKRPGEPVMFGLSPNITGSFQLFAGSAGASTGSFTDVGTDSRKSTDAVSGRTPTEKQFDASLSSSVYGGSEIVQPASLRLMPCIRT